MPTRSRACATLEVFPELAAITGRLREGGVAALEVRDISWHVAPSVAHIPRVTLGFLLDELRATGRLRLGPQRRGNVVAPLLGIVLGLARAHFGYHLIAGRR